MIRKQSAEEQLATMQRLIKFGVNEDTAAKSKPVVEFKRKAANGKTYGIIREATKYYIMEAPQKDTEILAEDFDYIGGFNNRKENEYSSYAKASNALDLKIMSINETVDKENRVVLETPQVKADWENQITESMRKEIDRFKTLTRNINSILTEGEIGKAVGSIPSEHTVPAPAQNPSDKEVNAPFTESGVANGEKDFKKEEHNHETAGGPFKENAETSVEKNMQSDKKPNVKTDSEDLTNEKTYEPDNNIASEHPSGGKVVKVNEGKKNKIRLRLTEEQVLAWNDNKNFIDMSKGTNVGSSDPFTDELGEESNQTEADTDPIIKEGTGDSVVYDHPTDQNAPTPGTAEVETEDGDPFEKKVETLYEVEIDDAAGSDDDLSDEELEALDGIEDEDEFEIVPDEFEPTDDALKHSLDGIDLEGWDNLDDDDYELYETKLDVFGKHPAYRKKPMTTPPNKEVAINGAREWDDISVQGEEPFGKQIGDSAPFDEVVDSITESIVNTLFSNKKKV